MKRFVGLWLNLEGLRPPSKLPKLRLCVLFLWPMTSKFTEPNSGVITEEGVVEP